MTNSFSRSILATALLAGLTGAQTVRSQEQEIRVPGKPSVARVWTETDPSGNTQTFQSLSLDGVTFSEPTKVLHHLELRYSKFDPKTETVDVPSRLRADAAGGLVIVQYETQGLEDYRDVLRDLGAEVHMFLAHNSNVVEMDAATAAAVAELPFVRSVSPFHPAFKLEEPLLVGIAEGAAGPITVNLLTTRRRGHEPVVAWIEANGGVVEHVESESYFMTATVEYGQLADLAALTAVQWIDRWGPPETDMATARQFHGATYVEANIGIRGEGVRGEVMDSGFETIHPDMQNFTIHSPVNTPGSHGMCTSGIVFGSGLERASATGCLPEGHLVAADYSSYSGGSRYNHSAELVNPGLSWKCVFQSNSWGSPQVSQYNSTSQQMDVILFDLEKLSITQSQSNTNSTASRPQAWAKNIIAVGGINHQNTLTKDDDAWGGASIGPAADGRIKPDLASFYDRIHCVDRVGSNGYSNTNYYNTFGGTSGATPITAGILGLFYQMWHRGDFCNPNPGATVFDNAPMNTTAKAMLINLSIQWDFSGTGHNLTRTHQGWGHASVKRMLERSEDLIVIDETDVLTNLDSTDYLVEVLAGSPEFRATMVYRDPAGTTSSTVHRINNLNLRVQSPSGTIYWGNNGLDAENFSSPDGEPNGVDTVENVWVPNPEAGTWTVTVAAAELNQDSHVETGAVDADYALVISGIEPDPTSPNGPTDLVGKAVARRSRVGWIDESKNEDGFHVERSSDGVNFVQVGSVGPSVTVFTDSGLTINTDYWYRVQAFNTFGTSPYSNVIMVRTQKFSPVGDGNP